MIRLSRKKKLFPRNRKNYLSQRKNCSFQFYFYKYYDTIICSLECKHPINKPGSSRILSRREILFIVRLSSFLRKGNQTKKRRWPKKRIYGLGSTHFPFEVQSFEPFPNFWKAKSHFNSSPKEGDKETSSKKQKVCQQKKQWPLS